MNADDYARAWGERKTRAPTTSCSTPASRPRRPAREIERALGSRSGPGGGNRRTARRPAERAQPPGPGAPDADRDADPDRRDPRDGRGDGQHGLAAPPAPGQAQARGLPRGELWRTILLESVLLLGVGCTTGAVFGLYGQQLLDRALANVISFPVVYSFGALVALTSLALVTVAAVAIVALPGYLATGVPPAVALQD